MIGLLVGFYGISHLKLFKIKVCIFALAYKVSSIPIKYRKFSNRFIRTIDGWFIGWLVGWFFTAYLFLSYLKSKSIFFALTDKVSSIPI